MIKLLLAFQLFINVLGYNADYLDECLSYDGCLDPQQARDLCIRAGHYESAYRELLEYHYG